MPFYIATLQLLVHAADDDHAFDALAALIEGERPIERPEAGLGPRETFLLDAAPSDLRPVAVDLERQIQTKEYLSTSAFGDWAWHSPYWESSHPGAGWYSREFGWGVSRDVATRYDGAATKPVDAPEDAKLVFIEH